MVEGAAGPDLREQLSGARGVYGLAELVITENGEIIDDARRMKRGGGKAHGLSLGVCAKKRPLRLTNDPRAHLRLQRRTVLQLAFPDLLHPPTAPLELS